MLALKALGGRAVEAEKNRITGAPRAPGRSQPRFAEPELNKVRVETLLPVYRHQSGATRG